MLSYVDVLTTTEEAAMRPMLVALTLTLGINAVSPSAQSGFASCFILFRPSEGKSIAYLTGSFPASEDVVTDQHKYLDPFVKFLASKYPPNGSGTVQAACNYSTSGNDVQQMTEQLVGPTDLKANSIVRTGWQP
jgi:hypothetical protein